MFKSVKNEVWAFDAEWVPDPQAGRALYELSDEMADEAVVTEMWRKNGATEEVPQPFLKLAISRVVSIALVPSNRARRWQDHSGSAVPPERPQ